MRSWPLVALAFACADGGGGDGGDAGDCAADGAPVLEFGQDLSTAPAVDGDPIRYGTPPQGGAPYAPFQVRALAEIEAGARIPLDAVAVEVGTGVELGSVNQSQAFICSNTGVHEGWMYGGELHVRFWDLALEDLEGREVEIRLHLYDDAALDVEAEVSGTLVWEL